MKKLLSTTALIIGLGLPTFALAQTAETTAPTAETQVGTDVPGFLAMRGESDIFASELMGHDVYARRVSADAAATEGDAAVATDGTGEMMTMTRADLDGMDNIGQINEIVLSHDGTVRAIVIGVGGFLGMGDQDVAVTMDQVSFASDPDDRNEMYIVVNTGADMLKSSPRYERQVMMDGTQTGVTAESGERTAFVAPNVEREGYTQLAVSEVSAELLVGKTVYGVNDDSVGTIDDLILDENGATTNVIIDFGGFLGMGTSQVSVGFDELTILTNEGGADVRVYVDATKEQVQAQPQYRASN
jgi:sporulation protein YlmC with PRC-barrel domain